MFRGKVQQWKAMLSAMKIEAFIAYITTAMVILYALSSGASGFYKYESYYFIQDHAAIYSRIVHNSLVDTYAPSDTSAQNIQDIEANIIVFNESLIKSRISDGEDDIAFNAAPEEPIKLLQESIKQRVNVKEKIKRVVAEKTLTKTPSETKEDIVQKQQPKEITVKKEVVIEVEEKAKEEIVSEENTPQKIIKKDVVVKEVVEPEKIIVEDRVVVEEVTPKPIIIAPRVVSNSQDAIALSINSEINTRLDNLGDEIFRGFSHITLKNNNLTLENGVWYTYVYKTFQSYGKGDIPTQQDYTSGGINKVTTLLVLDDTLGASYVADYTKVKLISDSIISGVSNKTTFLKELRDDKRYLHGDTDQAFIDLKNATSNLTAGLGKSGKIAAIYNYILSNISYKSNFSFSDAPVFSGISTFQNKTGICGGYTKLNLYMLSFAGVDSVSVVRGNVINAPDFPTAGHAWIRIGYAYYDPTFDDPIGGVATKSPSQYKYFGLPQDLFYTNRYNYGTMPAYLKTETMEARQAIVDENLLKLQSKYESNNYILLGSIQ